MAINKLVSIKQPILEALGDMGIDHSKNYPDFVRWTVRAERQIGSYYSLRKSVKVLTVEHFRAELPCEAMFAQIVVLGDHGNVPDLENRCYGERGGSYSGPRAKISSKIDTFMVVSHGGGGGHEFGSGGIKWAVQDNHVILDRNYHRKKITVQILGTPVDKDGLSMVCEDHVEADVAFCKWKWAQRSRFTPVKMDLGEIALLKKEWADYALDARANDDQVNDEEHKQMTNLWYDRFSGMGHNTIDGCYEFNDSPHGMLPGGELNDWPNTWGE